MQYDETLHVEVHVRSAGVAIVDADARILLVQENDPGIAGLWHIPAGTVEPGERLEVTAIREAKEETGLDVRLDSYLDTFVGRFESGDTIARHVWLASVIGNAEPAPQMTDEINDCRFVDRETLYRMYEGGQLRMYHTKLMYEAALAALGLD